MRTWWPFKGRQISTSTQIFILCFAVLLPVLVFALMLVARFAESGRQASFDSALDTARQVANALDRDLAGRISALRILGASHATTPESDADFQEELQRATLIVQAPIAYYAEGGQAFMVAPVGPVATLSEAVLAWEAEALGRVTPAVSNLLDPEQGLQGHLAISVPVWQEAELDGVITMLVSPSLLNTILLEAGLSPDWTAAIVDGEGRIVARSKDADRFVGSFASSDLRARATGTEGTWHGTTADGTPVLSAFARSTVADLRVAVGVPMAVIEAPLAANLLWFLTAGLLGLLTSALVALFFGGAVTGALSALRQQARDPASADTAPMPNTPLRDVNAVSAALAEGAKRLRREAEARDQAERALRASRDRFERLLQISPVGLMETSHTAITFANDTARTLLRLERTPEGIYTAPELQLRHVSGEPLAPEDNPAARALLGEVVMGAEVAVHSPEGTGRTVLTVNATPIEENGRITGALVVFVDITARYLAELSLREQTFHLETLNETGTTIAAQLDLENLLLLVTEAGVRLTGAAFGAFFYNTVDEKGESLTLYTIAGVPREHFSVFPMPRKTKIFAPTFDGLGTVRSDDITQDARYGKMAPHFGMPEGHLPVRSYLAVPVVSRTGEVIGGMFFGHPEPAVFKEQHEYLLQGIAGQTAVSIDNARLFEAAQKAEAKLREFNQSLETEIVARTGELSATNTKLLAEIAQRETIEEQLRQAQKMEAVGQLTGGIAHDFNNLLAIIVGSLDIMGRRLRQGRTEDLQRFVDAAIEGANRAATLTQRLLAFARRQPLSPEPLNLNKLVADMSDLLSRSITDRVRIETVLAAGLWSVHADRNQLENALVNLAVNARDAMPEGGQLTIETANFDLDERYVADHPGIRPGQYVLLAVTDTGTGMSQEVIARAFDPFFTTKEAGKGTGLGLSQIYGFVRQSGGHVKIYSEVGHGTTVKIYLPRFFGPTQTFEAEAQAELPMASSGQTVLVVEDEEAVRATTSAALEELGYRVLAASGAIEALRLIDAHPEIGLMFTDVIMPDINGRKLAAEAQSRRPDLKILFTSGYTRNAVVHNGVLDPGVQLIVKPFTVEQLGAKLKQMLDGE